MKSLSKYKSSFIIIIFTLINNVFALGRDSIISNFFGLSINSDIFYLSTTIPNILISWIAAALTTALIPLLLKYKNEKNYIEIDNVFRSLSITAVLVTVLILLFSYPITSLLAPNYSYFEKKISTELFALASITIYPALIVSFYTSISFIYKRFILQILFQVLNNVLVVICTILFVKTMSNALLGAVLAIVLSNFIQMIIFYLTLKKLRLYKAKKFFYFDKKVLRATIQFVKDTFPIFLTNSISFLNMLINRAVSTSLDVGSLTALNYASKVYSMPVGLFGNSVIMIFFTGLANFKPGSKKFIEEVEKIIYFVAIIFLPICFIFIFDKKEIISILFGYGKFSSKAVAITSIIFLILSTSIIFNALQMTLIKVYSLFDNKFSIYIGFLSVILNLILSLILRKFFGVYGIAISNSICVIIQVLLLLYRLNVSLLKKVFSLQLLLITFLLLVITVITNNIWNLLIINTNNLMYFTKLLVLLIINYFVVSLFFIRFYKINIFKNRKLKSRKFRRIS